MSSLFGCIRCRASAKSYSRPGSGGGARGRPRGGGPGGHRLFLRLQLHHRFFTRLLGFAFPVVLLDVFVAHAHRRRERVAVLELAARLVDREGNLATWYSTCLLLLAAADQALLAAKDRLYSRGAEQLG